jgi:hypothetical protein
MGGGASVWTHVSSFYVECRDFYRWMRAGGWSHFKVGKKSVVLFLNTCSLVINKVKYSMRRETGRTVQSTGRTVQQYRVQPETVHSTENKKAKDRQ